MIAAFKVELRLLHAGCSGSRGHWFFLGADVLHFHIGRPKFVENGFDNLAIGPRQNLPEDRAGDLHKQVFPFGAIQPSGLKPCGVRVDADPGFHALKKPFPGIRRSSHRKRKSHPAISTDVNKLWKAGPFSSFFRLRESCPYRSVLLSPGAPCAALQNCRPLVPPLSDSAGLSPIERDGASEKCAKAFTGVHTPCTVFP